MEDDEKMDEDKKETGIEEAADEEQEEEHERREVEDHNLIRIPIRSWYNHCMRGRGRRTGNKRRHDG